MNNLTCVFKKIIILLYGFITFWGGRVMLKKIMNQRIQKRLLLSSILSSAITMVASVIAIFVIILYIHKYSGRWWYNRPLFCIYIYANFGTVHFFRTLLLYNLWKINKLHYFYPLICDFGIKPALFEDKFY